MLSDPLFQAFLARCPDPALIEDLSGTVLDLNPAAERAYGWSREALVGACASRIVPAARLDEAARLLGRCVAGETVRDVETVRAARDGTELPVRLTLYRVLARNGDPAAIVSITAVASQVADAGRPQACPRAPRGEVEQLVAERTAALAELQERFALAVRGAGVGLYDHDLRTGRLWYSPRVKEMLGYRDDELDITLEFWNSRLHPDDLASIAAARRAHLEGGKTYDAAYRLRCRSGEYRWFRSHGESLRDEEGRIFRTAGTIADVDDLKRQEAASNESEAMLRAIIDNIPAAVFLRDRQGHYIMINRGYESMYGVEDAVARGRTVHESLVGFEPERWAAQDREVIETGAVTEQEFVLSRDGLDRTYAAVKFPVLDAAGAVVAVGGVEYDITERKSLEEQMAAARQAAEDASTAKSDFLANMSHEIRTPMNAIIGMSHLALGTDLDARQRNYVDKVHRSAQSLLGIINDILDFSKIEAGKLDLERTGFRLEDVMDNLANLLGLKAQEK